MNMLPNQPGGNEPDSKAMWMIVAFVMFFMLYQAYLNKKYPPNLNQQPQVATQSDWEQGTSTTDAPASNGTSPALEMKPEDVIPDADPSDLTIENSDVIYRMTQAGGFESIILKEYQNQAGPEGDAIELLDSPLMTIGSTQVMPIKNDIFRYHAQRSGRTIELWRQMGAFRIAQQYTFPDSGYTADIKINFENNSSTAVQLNAVFRMTETIGYSTSQSFLPGMPMERPTLVYSIAGSSDVEDLEGYCDDATEPAAQATNANIDYLGFDKHYFLTGILPKTENLSFTIQKMRSTEESCRVFIATSQEQGLVKPGETVTLAFQGYFGPKQIAILEAVDPALEQTIDFGIFAVIAKPLMMAMKGIEQYVGNFGVAIVILTILLKILFYPLVKASATSMHKMKKLNPQMQEMREKFKDDRQRQQQELMKFWKQHDINPMKGCFPILPQIPVFFAFYQTLRYSIELRHAPFFGWVQDLSSADPYYVTPILMAAAMFVQQKLTPTTGMDKTQEKIMMLMPVMFAGMMLTLPAGLTLYMLVNSLISIAQQQWLYRKLDKLES